MRRRKKRKRALQKRDEPRRIQGSKRTAKKRDKIREPVSFSETWTEKKKRTKACRWGPSGHQKVRSSKKRQDSGEHEPENRSSIRSLEKDLTLSKTLPCMPREEGRERETARKWDIDSRKNAPTKQAKNHGEIKH